MHQSTKTKESRIPLRTALRVLAEARNDRDLVITNQGSTRVWPLIDQHALNFHYNPSTMGGCLPFALGLALAQPDREVIALTGDGSLLMSMGSLVSVVASGCDNITVALLDNNIYDVTGGQKTAASDLDIDFAEIAFSIGYKSVVSFDDLESWQAAAAGFLRSVGPRFVWLRVDPALPEDMKTPQEPMADQLHRIRQELAKG